MKELIRKLKVIDKNDKAIGGTGFSASRNIIFAIVKIILAIFLGLSYLGVSIIMYKQKTTTIFTDLWVYTVATVAFWNFGVSIYGMIKYKRNRNLIIKGTKITNYAGSLVSIVTTQVVLMNEFYTGNDSMINQYNGLVGMIVSLVIVLTKEALKLLENVKIDLMLVDVMMPIMDGYELMRELRNEDNEISAIMITAKSAISDKLKGFETGIDDYMTKPIDFDELKSRIKVLLRRNKINQEIYLPKKEFLILYKLLSYPEVIFTKDQLLDSVWGMTTESDETTIRTHINRLRSKLDKFTEFKIHTIRGVGYKGEILENEK